MYVSLSNNPHPRQFFQFFRGFSELLPGQLRDIVPPACPGSTSENRKCMAKSVKREMTDFFLNWILHFSVGPWLHHSLSYSWGHHQAWSASNVTSSGHVGEGGSRGRAEERRVRPGLQYPWLPGQTHGPQPFHKYSRQELAANLHVRLDK